MLRVDGGYQGVRLAGIRHRQGRAAVSPARVAAWFLRISSLSAAAVILVLALSLAAGSGRDESPRPRPDHGLSFSSSFRMVSIKGPMICSLKSKRMPAAANSSGSGREPPSARAFL